MPTSLSTPHDAEALKATAARHAARMVESGMLVGLGSGSTSALVIAELGRRILEEGLHITGVPTSLASARVARQAGIPLVEADDFPHLDIALDGADEVDPLFRMIKGRGGALLREKIVAAAARRRVIVVDDSKLVSHLGRHAPVPVEVSVFGIRHTENALRGLGAVPTLRREDDGSPTLTDENHHILDCRFLEIADPPELADRLKSLVGVFETGLFVDLCDLLVVGTADGVAVRQRPA